MTEEGDTKRRILEALEAAGAFAFRVQSGMVKVRGGWMHLSPPGTSDILVIVPPVGRVLGLEVKTAKGKEREAQLAWADAVRRLGGEVRTVRSPPEAVLAYLEAKRDPGVTSGQPALSGSRNEYRRSFKGVRIVLGVEYRIYRVCLGGVTHWEAVLRGEIVAVAQTWGNLADVLASNVTRGA